jgi:hypothetical protein
VGVGITNLCNLVAFRQPEFRQRQSAVDFSVQSLVGMYELSFMQGVDHWDLVVATNPKIFDALSECLMVNFERQSATVRSIYFARFYSLLYSISRRRWVFYGRGNKNEI